MPEKCIFERAHYKGREEGEREYRASSGRLHPFATRYAGGIGGRSEPLLDTLSIFGLMDAVNAGVDSAF